MEGKQFFQRILSVAIGMGVIFCVFLGVLFNLQIVHGAEYAEKAQRKIANTEVVPASRGPILDRYGRPLVTNRVTYQVTLDVPLMGDAKSETILSLIAICKERGIVWTDTMPITQTAPYMLTAAAQGENTEKQLTRLGEKSNWDVSTADGLMGALRSYYKVPKTLSPEEDRALLGVLYEVALRKKEVTWSEYSFATDVDIDFISMVKEQQLVGVQVEPVTVRQYNTTAAPHLLGRTGPMNPTEWETYQELGYAMNETVGKDGAEQAFESWLRGTAGLRAVETNASGKIVSQRWIDAPQPGGNVITTMDLSLQQKLEESMKKHIPKLTDTVKGGAGVVIDVNTGAVRAMASYPDFDLTTIYKDTAAYEKAATDPLTPFVNRATQGLYSPGSTFKMVTAIGGLQEGIITPDTKLLDTGRY
ncbi:MAG: penicillin-binding transpeptidase domain-containing protein, partial [Oscillospiraceae bacterium]